ncbi:MAG: hypothetical protein PQJ60_08745 [Spirochaetales bacterium]|nr:hypothetical protein [Spirochaetales bacterium]
MNSDKQIMTSLRERNNNEDAPSEEPQKIYYHPDALEKLYLPQVDSMPVVNLTVKRSRPILITTLQETDLQNELAQRHGLDEITREELEGVRLQIHKDKARGKLVMIECDWNAVLALTREYTQAALYYHSWNLRELMHLCTARHLGFDGFLTPDRKLKELAELLGFSTPWGL